MALPEKPALQPERSHLTLDICFVIVFAATG